MQSQFDDASKRLLALYSALVECVYPVLFVGPEAAYVESRPHGALLWPPPGNLGDRNVLHEALADSGERRNGVVVLSELAFDEEAAFAANLFAVWPRMRGHVQQFHEWRALAKLAPWLEARGTDATYMPVLPSCILLPGAGRGALFVASESCAQPAKLLEVGVTCVVNCAAAVVNVSDSLLQLALKDDERQPLDDAVVLAVPWMDVRLSRGQSVLVHCERGVSRSVSIAASYLILKCGFSARDAITHMAQCRSAAKPNRGFALQLMERIKPGEYFV